VNPDFLFVYYKYLKEGVVDERYNVLPSFYRAIIDKMARGAEVFIDEESMKRTMTERGWMRCICNGELYLYNRASRAVYNRRTGPNLMSDIYVLDGRKLAAAWPYLTRGAPDNDNWPLWNVTADAEFIFE
jgi:hypothetical protein